MFDKSLSTLKQKSINENVKKSSQDGLSFIFDVIQEHVWEKEPEDVDDVEQERYPVKQEILDDDIAEEETPPDDDKNDDPQASKSIFDMLEEVDDGSNLFSEDFTE